MGWLWHLLYAVPLLWLAGFGLRSRPAQRRTLYLVPKPGAGPLTTEAVKTPQEPQT